jgi:molybdopterin molybdotransferase
VILMSESSPLTEAQQKFVDSIPLRSLAVENCPLEQATGRVLASDVIAPTDMPPYPRAIVEGFLVHTEDTRNASEEHPVSFRIAGMVKPGDESCPQFGHGEGIGVATGSLVSEGPFSVVRLWEAKQENGGFSITRPFPPRFFIEEQGCDLMQDAVAVPVGTLLGPTEIGTIASLGVSQVDVSAQPIVTIYSSGDEVIPYTGTMAPGTIRDSNSVMLAAAVQQAGGIPRIAGIMKDDFDGFVASVKEALRHSDMILISGGTAVGGRDFISDLLRACGKLVVDGVPMRSGRPLIMGHCHGKPIVCVAGHPPEALRGFRLFGVAAIDRLTGRMAELPTDS